VKVKVLEVVCRCGCLASAPEWMFERGIRCIICGRWLIPNEKGEQQLPDPPVSNNRRKKGVRKRYCNGGPMKWCRR
jgi:hypothetical protein